MFDAQPEPDRLLGEFGSATVSLVEPGQRVGGRGTARPQLREAGRTVSPWRPSGYAIPEKALDTGVGMTTITTCGPVSDTGEV
jgi:hypothetical protein